MVTTERIAPDEALKRAFDRKRTNFLDDYDLKGKPAPVWRAWPTTELEVEISSEELREALRGGGGAGIVAHQLTLKLLFQPSRLIASHLRDDAV